MPNATAAALVTSAANISIRTIDRGILQAQDAGGRERDDRADHPLSERDADDCGDGREQQAFDDELSHQASAAGAKRRPDRKLTLALHAPGEKQAGDVGAADHQDESDGREHHQQRQLQISHQVLAQRDDLDRQLRVGRWIFPPQSSRDRRQFGLRLIQRYPGFQPGDHVPPRAAADALLVILNHLRCPDRELPWPRQQLRLEVRAAARRRPSPGRHPG